MLTSMPRSCSKSSTFRRESGNRIAAERTGRVARMIELDPLYCDVICRRFEALTGKPAILDGWNQNFNDVEIERADELAAKTLEAAE